MAEWVQIKNPDLPKDQPPGLVTRRSYDLTWKGLGWKLVTPDKKPTRKDTD